MASKSAKVNKKEDTSLTLEAITTLLQQHQDELTSEFRPSFNALELNWFNYNKPYRNKPREFYPWSL